MWVRLRQRHISFWLFVYSRVLVIGTAWYKDLTYGTSEALWIQETTQRSDFGMAYIEASCPYLLYLNDTYRIYLVGQSAGAHIAACTLLHQAIKESGEGDASTWSIAQLKAYFGISGG